MNRSENRDPVQGNYSLSTGRLLEKRFDINPLNPVDNPHEKARAEFYSLDPAEKQLLAYWVKYALEYDAARLSYDGYHEPPTGGSFVLDLLVDAVSETEIDGLSLDELKGALLTSGRAFLPTFSSAGRENWKVPAKWVGIPASGPIRDEFEQLKAAVAV